MKNAIKAARATALIVAVGAPALAEPDIESQTWRWGHFSSELWGSSKADVRFAETLNEKTGGAIDVQFFWSGSMGSTSELLELTRAKAVTVGSIGPAYYPGQLPLSGLLNGLPLTWYDAGEAMRIQAELIRTNPYIQNELEENGIHPILSHGLPPYRLQCKSPVRKLEDLDGLRVRTFGEWLPVVFETLGAIPVNTAMTDIYESIHRGSLDCALLSVEAASIFNVAEVAPYWSTINFGAFAGYSAFVAQDIWDSWPEDFQSLVQQTATETETFEISQFAPLEDAAYETAKSMNVQVVEFEEQQALQDAVPDLLSEWQKQMCQRDLCDAAKSIVADVRRLME
ncbi:C4-dicarboxylate TRAP transporter substrate-binding protein [Roseovarius atlanticus]|uniref:C4-dicarboxylate TRAP transporter substrate-binding protein n=1 Tax=Roseovarius atlanticus TaxID=1641875 RepID=UPI001C989442|nr:C4-dicarboxylate TRAP transporter substrate-binding protein [Roseovarius atlanticus]MBY5989137.1 C4-dicarboxylate TRAP transporter substrate-binding protein [Roseovarius atlanticus]MBY6124529.1 C4-dicarboxylate TRAP transporter substrate-binding protein [Roseovarius atlanticus]MBY6149024.1 C4-dicarboxylate TRAP transporter substrate-binding protein [Roseovarius atlanticus]